ncbi:MAG TPA: hypothetical protein PLN25_12085 [Deltaproteobacteria bacterium]|nr:hypothetical protein [Deltaproteobacteria bacterium]HQB39919.1 hypothetical protein [Deltaproteobacteria bacterium]
MDKQNWTEKTVEMLRPFETDNLLNTIQTITIKEVFSNPILLTIICVLLYFGVIRRSKAVLLTMFALLGIIMIIRFAMPASPTAGAVETSLDALIPFIVGGVVIGGVIIYFTFIKSE